MPEDLKLSQIGSSQLPPPFRGLHSPGVRKHCQIIFACYFRKSSIDLRYNWAQEVGECMGSWGTTRLKLHRDTNAGNWGGGGGGGGGGGAPMKKRRGDITTTKTNEKE